MRTLVGTLLSAGMEANLPQLISWSRSQWAAQMAQRGVPPDPQMLSVPIALGAWLRNGSRIVHLSASVQRALERVDLPAVLPAAELAAELVLEHLVPAGEPLEVTTEGAVQRYPAQVGSWLVWRDISDGWCAIPHLLADGIWHAGAPIDLSSLLMDMAEFRADGVQRPDLQVLLAALVALCDERIAMLKPLPRAVHRIRRRRLQRAVRRPTRWERLTLAPTADRVWRVERAQVPQEAPQDALAPQGAPAPAQNPAGRSAAPCAPVAAHSVREHGAIVWVARPRNGEPVLGTRTRSLGQLVVDGQVVGERTSTLHAVRRPRAAHVRGSGAHRPRHQLLEPAG